MCFRLPSILIALLALGTVLSACAQLGGPTDTPAPPTATPTPTVLPTWTPVPTPVPGALYVDASRGLGPISPYVYGTNYGPWVIVPYDLLPQAEAAGIEFLRYPGGEWGDENDLQGYQIDQFIDLARRMGAEPNICVRLAGGTPEQAAQLVRYANVDNDYDVVYWSIGNEPNLYGDEYGTVQHSAEWRAIAEAMLEVDPDILLIGPNVTGYTGNTATDPKDDEGRDWMREFLLANGDLVDVVMIHRYPFPTSITASPATVDQLRRNAHEWDSIIPNLRGLIRETTGRDIPVGIGEINSHWTHVSYGEATPDSFYNAIWWGDVLGRLIRQRVEIVAHFILQSSGSQGGWGLLSRFEVRPSYYVYQVYKELGSELVYASSDDRDVSITAALREDGALTLVIVNLGSQEAEQTLLLSESTPSGPVEVWLFDADHEFEKTGELAIASGDTILLPVQSITLMVLPGVE